MQRLTRDWISLMSVSMTNTITRGGGGRSGGKAAGAVAAVPHCVCLWVLTVTGAVAGVGSGIGMGAMAGFSFDRGSSSGGRRGETFGEIVSVVPVAWRVVSKGALNAWHGL